MGESYRNRNHNLNHRRKQISGKGGTGHECIIVILIHCPSSSLSHHHPARGWINKLSPFLWPPWADDRIWDGFGCLIWYDSLHFGVCRIGQYIVVSGMVSVWMSRVKCNVRCPLLGIVNGVVPEMVLASAGGTGPIFPGATVPPDGNVANPTRPGTTLPWFGTQKSLSEGWEKWCWTILVTWMDKLGWD